MFAIIASPNAFWVYERLILSVLTGSAILCFFYAYKKIISNKETILKDTERWYLVLSAVHLIFQFIYNFLLPSTFFLYFAYVILYIELLCINDTFTNHLEGLSNNFKGWIETLTKYGTLGVLVFGIILVLEIDSDNQCGQNLFTLNLGFYTLLTICTAIELFYIIKMKSQKLERLSEQRSYDMGNGLGDELSAKYEGAISIRQYKIFFIKLLYVIVIGYLINSILFIYKLKPVAFGNVTCNKLFDNRSATFSIMFSVVEFIGFNLLNLFVFHQYFWIKRHEFNIHDEKVMLNEVYDDNRSGYIRNFVDDEMFDKTK